MSDGNNGLVPGDWRGPSSPGRTAAPQRPAFGKARELHLRSRPGTHREEKGRAQAVVSAGSEAVAAAMAAARAGEPLKTIELVEIVDAVTASLVRDPLALPSITRLRNLHEYTYMHSVAVCGWMVAVAQELELPADQIRDAGLAGLLHDIGKSAIPSGLLNEAAARSPEQAAELREHPHRGDEILREVPAMPELVLDVVRHHHERPDGAGYPDGLSGDALSIHARMAAVCNFYDKMTAPPPGIARWSSSQAIERLRAGAGEFDERVVRSFVRIVGAFPPGALVRMRSNLLGVVLDETERDPLHPAVAVFRYVNGGDVPWRRMSTRADPIIGLERPESWHFDDWPGLRAKLLELSE
ncbi:HD-GYP domain-containing protein [Sphingomonas sp.]|jgi:putative nucleotidyltransferase with HDIG domain|uniref:HD-GYP domain-containing protein n=1 Tax=Sphingomonas sp. TaxID=28214 RepID=UPI002E378243|nr:HD-GYP domain-containing protein [Sphingomonas sp.]HEX4695877.1 HD-GYP domain-containing protein [Sphingomonas sp.]